MQTFQKALARTFAILLTFSMVLSPVAAQTSVSANESSSPKDAAGSAAITATGKTPAGHGKKRTKSNTASQYFKDKKEKYLKEAREDGLTVSRSDLINKAKGLKTKLSDVKAVGGVGINGYPPLLIGPGDLLDILVYGEDELPFEYQVDSDGIITYPYIGNVRVGGLSPSEASEKLAHLLGKERKVTVLIKESNTYWVSILGNVGKPGKYQIHGKPTLLSALAEAGGPIPGAKLNSTVLIHKGVKSKVNLNKYLKGEGPIGQEPLLFPGDVLVVPKSGLPSMGEIAIVASILASAAVVTVELNNLHRK